MTDSLKHFSADYQWDAREVRPRKPNTKVVAVIIGTRPEAIKMAPVIKALQRRPDRFDVRVVLTGQHPAAADILHEDFGIVENQDLAVLRLGQSLDELAGKIFLAAEAINQAVFSELDLDMMLVQGDTISALGFALVGFHNKVPVGHVEAGLRTFDRLNPWPEEMNRRLIGTLADVHFPPTAKSRDALLGEGVRPTRIALTGNTVIDALQHAVSGNHDFSGTPLESFPFGEKRLIVATMHRRESWGVHIDALAGALIGVVDAHPDTQMVLPVHPNPDIAKLVRARLGDHPRIFLVPPLRYGLFVKLMSKAYLILTDSGGVQEEAPSLDVPALVMRDTTERGEAISGGQIKLIGRNPEAIVREASKVLGDDTTYAGMRGAPNPFGDGQAGARIALALDRFLDKPDVHTGLLLKPEEEFAVGVKASPLVHAV